MSCQNFAGKLDYDKVETKIINWIKEKVQEAGMEGAVVGLSGGIDSAVTSLLCQKAFPNHFLAVILPCNSQQQDIIDAENFAKENDFDYLVKDLSSVLEEMLVTLTGNKTAKNKLSVVNIKPRLRMTVLYYYAAENNYLVVGTDNWSELKVGYFTKHGDGGVDIAPLGTLVKTEVRQLASHLNIPHKIINKPPSAGLWEGQTDEEELGISYQELDKYILTGKAQKDTRKKVEKMADNNRHKLEPIPVPDRSLFIS